MKKFISLFDKKILYMTLLFSFSFASLIIVIALFMGQEAGNFVIEVEAGDVQKNLFITENINSENHGSRLEAGAFEGISHSTYARFKSRIPTYQSTSGVYMDKDLHVYAYTLYVLNNNEETFDLKATMYYSNVTNGLDKAIRVMTITEEFGEQCYQLVDDVETDYGVDYPKIKYFTNETDIVYEEEYLSFEPSTYIRYTVLFWLEGNDLDCNDERRLGTIRFSLKFSIM